MPREWVAEAIVGGARPRVTSLPRLGQAPYGGRTAAVCAGVFTGRASRLGGRKRLCCHGWGRKGGGARRERRTFYRIETGLPPTCSPPNIPPETNGAQEMIRCKIGRDARGSTPHKGPKPKGSPRSVAFRLVSASGSGAPNLEARRAVGHTPDGRKGEEGEKTSIIYVTVCVCCGGEGRPYLRAKSGSRGSVVRVAGG